MANTSLPSTPALPTWSTRIIDGQAWCSTPFTVAEGLTSEQIVARLLENDVLDGSDQGYPARGHAAAGDLQIHPRHDARADHSAHAARAHQRVLQEIVGASHARSAGEDAGATGHARFDCREGDRQAGGAFAGRLGLHQPAEEQDAAAIRSDHHLRPDRRQGHRSAARS